MIDIRPSQPSYTDWTMSFQSGQFESIGFSANLQPVNARGDYSGDEFTRVFLATADDAAIGHERMIEYYRDSQASGPSNVIGTLSNGSEVSYVFESNDVFGNELYCFYWMQQGVYIKCIDRMRTLEEIQFLVDNTSLVFRP